MNGVVRTFWIILFAFVLCGWLIRDHFHMAGELEETKALLVQYSNTVAELEQQLRATQASLGQAQTELREFEQQYGQINDAYNALLNQAASDAQRIAELEGALASARADLNRKIAEMGQYQTACENMRQSVSNEIQACRGAAPGLPPAQATPNGDGSRAMSISQPGAMEADQTLGSTDSLTARIIGALLVLVTLTAGAVGAIIDRSRLPRRVGASRRASVTRTHQAHLQPLVLRRNGVSRAHRRPRDKSGA